MIRAISFDADQTLWDFRGVMGIYGDVQPAIDTLRGQYRLGLLTNVYVDPEHCGLPGVFDAVVFGPEHGFEKPHPRAFELIAVELGVAPTELLHVGDDVDDVLGANTVGAVSVLIDRGESDVDPELREGAGFAIRTLTELPAVLASLG